MPGKLDRKLVKEACGKSSKDFADLKVLDASNRNLTDVSGLTFLPCLARLDVRQNVLKDISGLAGCTSLRWLNLSANQLTTVEALSDLPQLQVLNISHNQISGKLRLKGFPALCALIANDNAITGLKGLGVAAKLNTLVLKSNRISTLGKALAPCTSLAKLSVGHNQLTDIDDSLSTCNQLAELRIGHNQISHLPSSLSKNLRLKIVELGGNNVETTFAVEVLRKLPHLASCSLKGCPVADAPNYQQQMQALLPSLQILDGRKGGRNQQAAGEQNAKTESVKAKKRKPSSSKGELDSTEAVIVQGSQKAAKRRRVTFVEQQEEFAGEDQTGKESTSSAGSKELQAKRKKKAKKGENPASENLPLAKDTEAGPSGQADSTLDTSSSQDTGRSKKHDVRERGEGKVSLHGKLGRKGAEIGAALQKGLLGTVMTPEEALAPGWD